MRIATFNINGIRARIEALTRWLEQAKPDVVCLQEIKSVDEAFPRELLEDMGYQLALHGQKGFNGTAILSRFALEDVVRGLEGDESDAQARWIEATIACPRPVRLCCLYLPNGNPAPGPKYDYKLAWMARMEARLKALLKHEEPVICAGDYNVIPQSEDAAQPEKWHDDALFLPQSRAAYRRLLHLGMSDAFRCLEQGGGHYSFWDYQGHAWERGDGIRIDHLLLSPQAADRLTGAGIDQQVRAGERPSDHVPVWIELAP